MQTLQNCGDNIGLPARKRGHRTDAAATADVEPGTIVRV